MVLPALLVVQNLGPTRAARSIRPRPGDTRPDAIRRFAPRCWPCWAGYRPCRDWKAPAFVLRIDDWDRLERRLGAEAAGDLLDECHARLCAALRGDDLVASLGPATFGVVLHPIAAARLRIRDAIADRLRAGLATPVAVGADLRAAHRLRRARRVAEPGALRQGRSGRRCRARRRLSGARRRPAGRVPTPSGPSCRDRRGGNARSPSCPTKLRERWPRAPSCPGSSRSSTCAPAGSRGSRRWRAGSTRRWAS